MYKSCSQCRYQSKRFDDPGSYTDCHVFYNNPEMVIMQRAADDSNCWAFGRPLDGYKGTCDEWDKENGDTVGTRQGHAIFYERKKTPTPKLKKKEVVNNTHDGIQWIFGLIWVIILSGLYFTT